MRTFIDAKAMAKALRTSLDKKQVALSHSECLEIVAAQFGVDDRNILAAKIAASGASESGALRFKTVTPVLRIFSVDKAMEFYVGFLGFTLDWEHRFDDNSPLYAQVSRAGAIFHLSEHHGDASPGATVFVDMEGIAAYHRELTAKKYTYNKPGLEDTPWGTRTMQIADPFGNRVRFSEPKGDDSSPQAS